MTLQNTGLTGGGLTQNFQVEYQDSLYTGLPAAQQAQVQANLTANANYLLGAVEGAFTTTTGWFAHGHHEVHGPSNRQQVYLDQLFGCGAFNTGYGNPIHVDGQDQNATLLSRRPRSGDGVVPRVGRRF